ncbi:MAG: alpha-amylase family glycosyl hydrolase, partial [Verrucomicrobiales bacterium]
MSPLDQLILRIETHLSVIYGEGNHSGLVDGLVDAMRLREHFFESVPFTNHWAEKDVALITYGDTIQPKFGAPLAELRKFVTTRLGDAISIIHVLPYFPWTSDDGFAVSDYNRVNPDLGDWSDLETLSEDYRIMSDLVVNHCSASHEWFKQFEQNEEPGRRYICEASPDVDLSEVVRPRTSDLLRTTETPEGTKYVWCTFGHDQVDLNFREKDLLVELVKIIRSHLDHGVSVFRLDAVAFVWKKIGTGCINLPETHELVRLFRTLIEHVKPDGVIITETNIPNQENLSYFGNGNEAHGIYNFSLPPLLLYALTNGNSRCLIQWLMRMPPAQPGTMYFNFIASHDGIGLRPAEGLLSLEEIDSLVERMVANGGLVSERTLPDGSKRPYEINISLFDA